MNFYVEIILRLVIAAVLGAVIGLERAGSNHDAGMRTHLMVSLGAAGVMVIGDMMSAEFLGTDPARIGAQVVSGIGFLGAGCILVNGNRIKGLTTAAGLWTTACVGLASGLGYYLVAGVMTGIMLIGMLALRPLANRLKRRGLKRDYTLIIGVVEKEAFKSVIDSMHEQECKVTSISEVDDNKYMVKLLGETEESISKLVLELMETKNIKSVERN